MGRPVQLSWLLMVWVVSLALQPLHGQTIVEEENRIKAAFLCNFPKFVEWPAGAFADATSPIVVGVLGQDPFGPILEQTVEGKTVGGRSIEIQRSQRPEDLKSAHVIFISRSEEGRITPILQCLQGASILTVSECPRFACRGGVVNFTMLNNHLDLEINTESAEDAGLRISSRLLKLATLIRATAGTEGCARQMFMAGLAASAHRAEKD